MHYLVALVVVLFASLCLAETEISAGNSCPKESAAILVSLQGNLFVDAGKLGHWQAAQLNDAICEGSRVRVEANSRASLLLPDDIILRLDAGTVLSLNGIGVKKPTMLDMLKGIVHFISRTPRHLEITTPIANAGPEGTEFVLRVDSDQTSLWVYEGAVRFYNDQGTIHLNPGEAAVAQLGQMPRAQLDIKPQDAVNWALYYPSLLPNATAQTPMSDDLRTAITDFRHGRIDVALSRLDALPPELRNLNFFKVRAAIQLSTGQVESALVDIQALQTINPNDAEALAMLSVIALTQNHKDQANTLANQAVAANPQSAAAFSALSYTEQSRFELEKALAAADQAIKNAPQDALVWARKAELELSMGLIADSELAAKQASTLDPELERTQTVMGFTYLLHSETTAALQTFGKAVELDSASPMARLGLGLAKIRNGDLEAGRQNLEIATGLNPANALIRSYLGKAYYEEKRVDRAQDQLDLAKQRDPNDPTAYFYDAILKLTTNRPVEALRNIDQAIDLNDNRGVYRSSLSLDRDAAARSAAQGRIYNELGYQQLGLLEGWKSLDADSNNYSAHRLLADDYAALPRHEIARVSELLQSQLLQPVNITPIQPNLEETSLFVLNSLGPANLGFNEFNPLFEYNRASLQASGIYGGNNTRGDNVQLSGIRDNLSFSLGQFNYGTDGFRENNFFRQNLYNAFLQYKASDHLNLQFEYRHEITSNGDLALNFDAGNYDNGYNKKTYTDSYRIGNHYEFNPNSSLIGSFIYQNVKIAQSQSGSDLDPFGDPEQTNNLINYKRNGFVSELQHSYINSSYSLINGVGHIDQQLNSTVTNQASGTNFFTGLPQSQIVVNPTNVSGFRRTNLYNYSKFFFTDKLSATLGVSLDFYNYGNQQLTPVNPKFGIVWSPFASTTFRTAIFRTLSVTDYSNQTIEPTQVAGFNQMFDDVLGTISWRYGVGVDHKFSDRVSSGLEIAERNLNIPIIPIQLYRSERTARAYLNYIPHDWVSLGLEYFYEKIDQPRLGQNIQSNNAFSYGLFNDVETHRIPLTLSFFHPSGLSLKLKNSFVHQSGVFQEQNMDTLVNGTSNFFVSDLNLSYRFPNRHGMLSVGVNNLFDNRFNFQNTDYNNVLIFPSRVVFSRITLAF